MLGIYLQRSWIILLISGLFLVPVYVFSAQILVLIGQDKTIASLAGKFTIWTIPLIFALCINVPAQKFLQAQSKVAAFTWIGFIAVMLCLEIWYLMSLTVLAGHFANAEVAVDSISICVRVSNELGCGHPRAAKISVVVVVITSLIIGIFFSFVILAARDHIAILFTSSDIIQQAVSKLAPILTVTMVLNSIQPVISGVAVGGGWQTLVAYINLACYYIFGLPLGYLLGYKFNMGVKVKS
ncbi:hypothetical protein AMTRI_Chr07g29910 [Amborella trichopoda]